ncbi:hypothetical protein MMRN_46140 [Mycobacterium marinum]|nr:hypothetical protein MMRN_46140 [Mycobacterium marinum]
MPELVARVALAVLAVRAVRLMGRACSAMTAVPAVPAGSRARLALVGSTVPAVLAVPVVLAVWVLIVGWRRGPAGPVALVAPAEPEVGLDPVLVAWVPVVTAGPVVPAVLGVWAVVLVGDPGWQVRSVVLVVSGRRGRFRGLGGTNGDGGAGGLGGRGGAGGSSTTVAGAGGGGGRGMAGVPVAA